MTPIVLLFGVVMVQVLVFQFLSVRLARALPDQILGLGRLPEPLANRIAAFKTRSGRVRYAVGGGLILLAGLASFVLPLEYGGRKLIVAAVSLASSIELGIRLVFDRRRFARILDDLPEPPLRAASLRRKKLSDHYAPVWEALPIALLMATIGLTIWLASGGWGSGPARTGGLADARLWIIPVLQAALLVLLTILAVSRAALTGILASRVRAYHDHPEEALDRDEKLRRLEIRYLFLSKTGVVLLLGLIQLRWFLADLRRDPEMWLVLSPWALVLLLLAVFVGYLLKVSQVKRVLGGAGNSQKLGRGHADLV